MAYSVRERRRSPIIQTVWAADSQSTLPPVSDVSFGDLLIDTGDSNALYLWDARQWVKVSRGAGEAPAAHATTHQAAGSDAIALDTLAAPTDITTLNVSSTLHGLCPKSPALATQFLNGAATPAFAAVKESDLAVTDVTTNNVTSTAHGLAPKSPAAATQFLNGAATPAFAAVKESDLAVTDVTTNNVTSTAHGLCPKSPAAATQFLNGAATPAFAAVKDADLSVTDITTNNATTALHGFLPKLGGGTSNFLRADGTWTAAVPSLGRIMALMGA